MGEKMGRKLIDITEETRKNELIKALKEAGVPEDGIKEVLDTLVEEYHVRFRDIKYIEILEGCVEASEGYSADVYAGRFASKFAVVYGEATKRLLSEDTGRFEDWKKYEVCPTSDVVVIYKRHDHETANRFDVTEKIVILKKK